MQETPNKIGRFSVGKSIALQQWAGKSFINDFLIESEITIYV
jgi:hypothetical protein